MGEESPIVLVVVGGQDLGHRHWDAGLSELARAIGPGGLRRIAELHHGDRRGWDRCARAWAIASGVPHHGMPAEAGQKEGLKKAQWGKRRNWLFMAAAKRRAAELGGSCVCLAGWNGSSDGTSHGIAVASFLDIRVVPYRAWHEP